MSGPALASVACALLAALCFAVAATVQQHAASGVDEDESLLRELVTNPRWWAGIVGDGGGYALQVVALALGSVLIVQPIIVLQIVFALPLAARFAGRRITPKAWALAAVLTAALACFLVVGDPSEGDTNAPLGQWLIPLGLTLGVVLVAAVAGLGRLEPGHRALLLGTASGLLYGVAAALTKYVTDLLDKGVGTVLGSWQTWTLVLSGIIGVVLQQKAFQVGPLVASLPAVTVAEPLGAAFLGIAVLDERLRTDGAGIVVIAVAVVVMCAAAVALSRSQAHEAVAAAAAN